MLRRPICTVCACWYVLWICACGALAQAHTYETLHAFAAADRPVDLFMLPDGKLCGCSATGGANNAGYLFRMQTDGSAFVSIHDFATATGQSPTFLASGGDGWLYGSTTAGGAHGHGTLFRVKADASGFQDLHDFTGTDGNAPNTLVFGSDMRIYGCASGGSSTRGVLYRIRRDGTGFLVVCDFANSKSMYNPSMTFMGADGALYGLARSSVSGYDAIFRIAGDGSTVKDLRDFSPSDGDSIKGLIQGADGALYGYTWFEGPGHVGNVFTLKTDGTGFRDVHDFNVKHIYNTVLMQGSDHRLYGACEGYGWLGTTIVGQSAVVWSMATDGSGFQVLHDFGGSYEAPYSLAFGSDGALYGFTYGESVYVNPAYGDTLFRLTTDGMHFDYLHWFSTSGSRNLLATGANGTSYGLTEASNSTPAVAYSHTVTPDPKPSLTLLSPASLPGETAEAKATLTLNNKALEYMPIDFLIDIQANSGSFDLGWADTDSSGVAELSFPVPTWFTPAQLPFHVYSPGTTTSDDVTLQPVRQDAYFTVLTPSAIVVASATGTIGWKSTLTATLNSNGTALPAEPVAFSVGSTVLGGGVTDANGKAVLSCVIPAAVGVGNLTLTVQFAGDSVYGPSAGTASLAVSKASVSIATLARTARQNQNTVLVGTLTRATDHSPLANEKLRFQIDGTAAGAATTDATGKGSLTYTVPATMSVGKHTVSIFFDGDSLDTSGSVTTTLTVNS